MWQNNEWVLAETFAKFPRSHIKELKAARANLSYTEGFTKVIQLIIWQQVPVRYRVTGEISMIDAETDMFCKILLIWFPVLEFPHKKKCLFNRYHSEQSMNNHNSKIF